MKNKFFKSFALCTTLSAALFAEDVSGFRVVDYGTCLTESKYGKEEQQNIEKIRAQISSLISETEKELQEIDAKLDDQTFVDSLSPKANEELTARQQTLLEDRQRYQWQINQIMQQAQYQLFHKVNTQISRASTELAKEKSLAFVFNKEICPYNDPSYDLTQDVLAEMDKNFDLDNAQKKSDQHKAEAAQEASFEGSAE